LKPSEIVPVMTVKRAAIAKYSKILLSKASLIDSMSGGICGNGFVLAPKL